MALAFSSLVHAQAMQSANYSIPKLVNNQGSGFRSSTAYQATADIIADQPVVISTSASYTLSGRPLVTVESVSPSCGIFINDDASATSSINVDLDHYGSRSKRGTEVAALFYGLIETAKLVGVEPRQYLLEAAVAAITRDAVLLPHQLRA